MQEFRRKLTLMAVHAHPDDEAIVTGGLLAQSVAAGVGTVLVTATRGELGEILDPTIPAEIIRPRLGHLRVAELRRAAAVLGIDHVALLGYRDSGMAGTDGNGHRRCFAMANLDVAVGRLVRLIRRHRPHVVVTYDEDGGYGHPDHIRAHQVTVAAFDAAADPDRFPGVGGLPWQPKKLYYAGFPRQELYRAWVVMQARGLRTPLEEEFARDPKWQEPLPGVWTRVDVRAYYPQKLAALLSHRSQVDPDDPFWRLPDDLAPDVWGFEYFYRARCLVPAPRAEEEDDVFAGLDDRVEMERVGAA